MPKPCSPWSSRKPRGAESAKSHPATPHRFRQVKCLHLRTISNLRMDQWPAPHPSPSSRTRICARSSPSAMKSPAQGGDSFPRNARRLRQCCSAHWRAHLPERKIIGVDTNELSPSRLPIDIWKLDRIRRNTRPSRSSATPCTPSSRRNRAKRGRHRRGPSPVLDCSRRASRNTIFAIEVNEHRRKLQQNEAIPLDPPKRRARHRRRKNGGSAST